jgi:hypothetical protein
MTDILDIIRKSVDAHKATQVLKGPKRTANPMFDTKDLRESDDQVAKLVKLLFITNGVTEEKFTEMWRRYAQREHIVGDSKRSNLSKALKKNNITWRTFVVDVLPMFGLILQNVVLTLKDPETGEVKTLSMNDVNQRISNEFPNDYHGLRGIQINCVDANTLQTQHIDTADAGKKE